eukprot:gnl/TRDRNA2_/TRDRNA2_197703_c0_seq1.p1 gnl/TRDRNA2_/TRDRNA2_197703_c0~~gnl/TRDRNA2_/TRDRNA2_197703_c0_seq1.p1  ORF type:complete len:444 (+),score=56.22 gnl/TRDRNA2_/TRDRNA2_197703_c0_seq1:75-1406(+)
MEVARAFVFLICARWLRVASAAAVPESKRIVWGMDKNIHQHTKSSDWDDWSKVMAPYWSKDFVYDFVHPFPKTHGLHDWFKGEHSHFNEAFPACNWTDMIFAGSEDAATFCSYGIARWTGPFAGVHPPKGDPTVHIRDLDFYAFSKGKISYNWCMIDVVDIFQQVGYNVLPPAPLPNDGYNPPRAMDGIPAPDTAFVDPSAAARATIPFRKMIDEDLVSQSLAMRWWAEDMIWYGPGGIGTAKSRGEYLTHFLKPFHASFSNPKLELNSLLCEGTYCGAHFYIVGNHTDKWLGQSATGRLIRIRFGIHARVRLDSHVDGCGSCGQIVDGWAQMDIPDAFAQMGVDLFERAKLSMPDKNLTRADSKESKSMLPTSLDSTPDGGMSACAPVVFVSLLASMVAVQLYRRRARAQNAAKQLDAYLIMYDELWQSGQAFHFHGPGDRA